MIVLFLLPGTVFAQSETAPTPDQLSIARARFQVGVQALEAEDIDGGIAAFEQSYAAARRPSALFMLGVSYRRRFETTGELADAGRSLEYYQQFIDRDPNHVKVREARETMALLQSLVTGAKKRKASGVATVGSREYRQAVGLLGEGRFAEAIEAAEAAHSKSTSGPDDVSRIWLIIGRAQAIGGDPAGAARSFQNALSLNPKLRLSADIDSADMAAFETARTELRGKAPLAISARAPDAVRRGDDVAVSAHVDSDPTKLVHHLVLHYRWAGTEAFAELAADSGAVLTIPPPAKNQDRLFYYLTAVDTVGALVGLSGTPNSPLSLTVVSKSEWNRQFPTADPGSATLRLTGIGAVGVGVGAVIFGILQGLKAKELSDELQGETNGTCPFCIPGATGFWDDNATARLNDAKSAERNMIVLVSVGSAAIIGGGVLYYLGRAESPMERGGARLSLTPRTGGMTVGVGGPF